MSEDVWPFISSIQNRKNRSAEIEDNAILSERDLFLFSGEDNVLYVAPYTISEAFLSYFTRLTGIKNFRVVVPKQHTGVICEDVTRDRYVMEAIVAAANSSRKLTMTSYATSLQFLHLAESLRKKGIAVSTPDAPEEEDAWTVNFFGSKSGIRQLAQQSSSKELDFRMPDGVICSGLADAARIAANRYVKERGVVLKINKGHSGLGVLIFRPGDLPEIYRDCETVIRTKLSEEKYWNTFPIVIERFIEENPAVGGGFPNVEFRVSKTGKVEFLYYCGMRVAKDGTFKGIEIHTNVVLNRVATQMIDTGYFIGEQYAKNGYRGYFDVDFVAARNGELYVTESNVRRTGGTFVYMTALRWFGKNFMDTVYTLSNNAFQLPGNQKHTFEGILKTLTPILFNKKKREGLVIVSEQYLALNRFSYIIFGRSERRALAIETEMESLLLKE
jgi:hypothetical protein